MNHTAFWAALIVSQVHFAAGDCLWGWVWLLMSIGFLVGDIAIECRRVK